MRVPGTDRFLLTRHQLGLKADADNFLLVDMDGRTHAGRVMYRRSRSNPLR